MNTRFATNGTNLCFLVGSQVPIAQVQVPSRSATLPTGSNAVKHGDTNLALHGKAISTRPVRDEVYFDGGGI